MIHIKLMDAALNKNLLANIQLQVNHNIIASIV